MKLSQANKQIEDLNIKWKITKFYRLSFNINIEVYVDDLDFLIQSSV